MGQVLPESDSSARISAGSITRIISSSRRVAMLIKERVLLRVLVRLCKSDILTSSHRVVLILLAGQFLVPTLISEGCRYYINSCPYNCKGKKK